MSLGSLMSRIFGFLRDICIAGLFSASDTDVFFAALRFPNFFRRWLGEGSFSASVTPVLAESLQKDGARKAKELSACFATYVFCLSGILTLIGIVFMEEFVHWFFASSPAYTAVEGKLEQTVIIARLVFSYLFFVSLYAYFMSALMAFGRFFLPALAPALFNISLIGFCFIPKSWQPFPSYSLGWAVVAGGALQLLPIVYEMSRLKMPFRLRWRANSPLAFQALKRFPSGMAALSVLSLTGMINLYFAGQLPEGAISHIYYGDRLLEFPRALIALSIGSALIPELTRLVSLKNTSAFQKTLDRSFQMTLFLILPCALVFAASAQPLIELLFERGRFGPEAVSQTAMILQIYSMVLLFASLSRALSSAFFALDKNAWIAFCSVLTVAAHWGLAFGLTPLFGLKGLAWASALSSLFYFVCLLAALFGLRAGFSFKNQALLLLRSAPGLGLLALCLVGFSFIQKLWLAEEGTALFPLALMAGGGLYLFSAFLLKEACAFELARIVRSFFIKRSSN